MMNAKVDNFYVQVSLGTEIEAFSDFSKPDYSFWVKYKNGDICDLVK